MSYLKRAKELAKSYVYGEELTEEELHVLHDTALEHGQILDNVVRTRPFVSWLAENLEALDCF